MNDITLTVEQQQAKRTIENAEPGIILLEGLPGTGKTTILKSLNLGGKVALCAMTALAANNLAQAFNGQGTSTFHSYFQMYPWIDEESGGKTYTSTLSDDGLRTGKPLATHVVDEVSMLSSRNYNTVYSPEYQDMIKQAGFKVILVGDRMQLPPPRADNDAVFEDGDKSATVFLTEVVRHGGVIVELAHEIRRKSSHAVLGILDQSPLRVISRDSLKKEMEDTDTYYLAWTNKAADSIGRGYIQEPLYRPVGRFREWQGDLTTTFKEGELSQLATVKPWMNGKVDIGIPLFDGLIFHLATDYSTGIQFVSADKATIEQFQFRQEAVRLLIQRGGLGEVSEMYGIDLTQKKKAWFLWHSINDVVWVLRPHRSMTVHRSQGQTLGKVIIDVPDIAKCRDTATLKRLVYTALTRAKDEVILLY